MWSRAELTSNRAALAVVVVAAGVVLAAVLSPVVLSALPQPEEERPSVAVLTLRGTTSDANVNTLARQLRQVREDGNVEAVVIRIDSAGGPVTSSEEFYYAVNRTAARIPVVAYVEGTAASGGYYGIVAADEIVVKPSANVGSVGVIIQAPLSVVEDVRRQQESYIRSGPDKAQVSKDGLRRDMEVLKRAFVGTVMRHRGDELTLGRTEVAHGAVYLGTVAVENGFADRLGDLELAIQRAAALSPAIEGDGYEVRYWDEPGGQVTLVFGGEVERVDDDVVFVSAAEDEPEFVPPVRYYAVWGVPADWVDREVTVDG